MIPKTTAIPLETLSNAGKPPEYRIKDASDCAQIADAIIYANQERSRFGAKLRGMFDGNPPFSVAKLRNEAQAWRANVNFLEGKAARSAALVPFYDLFSGAKHYAQVQTNIGNDEEKAAWSGAITEEFDWLLKSYDGFDFNMQQMLNDLVGYGKGFLTWPDNYDWRFRCTPQHRIYVTDGTDCYAGNLEVLVIRQSYKAHELWKYIRDKEEAKQAGWDIKGTINAIIHACPEIEGDSQTQYSYEWIQQRIKDRDLYIGVRAAVTKARHVLVREFDGKVSHYIIEELNPSQKALDKDRKVPSQFLYQCAEKFEDFRQFVAGFFLETGDGSWNGAQGLGHDVFSIMALKDRIKCAGIDLMFLRTGVNLQAKTANALQKASIVRHGPVNVIPPEFDIQQSTILGDIESPLVMDRMLDQVVSNNTGIYRQRQTKPQGNPRTAKEVELEYQQEATLSNSAVNRFYLQLDPFYSEIYRRATTKPYSQNPTEKGEQLVKEFFERLYRRGVPSNAIRDVAYVRAYRNAGNGSAFMRQQAITQTLPFFGMLPEDGKRNFVNFSLASIHGQAMVNLFNPPRAQNNMPNDQEAYALLENAALHAGAPVLRTPSQNDFIHANVHLNGAAMAVESLQQGGDPAGVATFIDAIGKHTTEHLAGMAGDKSRQGQLKMLQGKLKALAQMHDKLMEQLDQMQEHQQEQQQETQTAMTDDQIKQMEAQADVRRKDLKTGAQMHQSGQKHAQMMSERLQQMQINDMQAAAAIKRENALAKAKTNGDNE